MQLRILFFFAVTAFIGTDAFELLCNLKRARNYKMDILLRARNNPSYEGICRSMRKFLNEVSCRGMKRYDEIEELKQKLIPILRICPTKDLQELEVQVDAEKCLKSIEPNLTKCVSDAVMEVLLGIPQNNGDKSTCPDYYFVAKCLEHINGEDSFMKDQSQLKDIILPPLNVQDNCLDSIYKGGLRSFDYFSRKEEFVFLPKYVADEIRCVHEKAYESKVWLYFISGLERSYEDICAGVGVIRNRLNKYNKKCKEAERYQEIEELRLKVDPIMDICPGKDQKVPIGMKQCVKSIEKELRKCVIDALLEVSMGKTTADADKSRCSYYQFVIQCVVHKNDDRCGKEPGNMVLTGMGEMADLPDEIQESCGYSVIKDTSNELAYDINKSRKK